LSRWLSQGETGKFRPYAPGLFGRSLLYVEIPKGDRVELKKRENVILFAVANIPLPKRCVMTFITELEFEGHKFAGPDIEAESWASAEAKAQEIGFRVVGELDTRLVRA
jgi:hypothetical protein